MKRIAVLIAGFIFSVIAVSIPADKKEKINYKSYIAIEAEDAIVTNFASRATSFFFASNKHTLQLSKDPSGSKSEFFAKYVFFNTIDREYEIWLGATPPGGKTNPYISPVTLIFDEGKPYPVTAESVLYSERYTHGGFYFYRCLTGRIPHGQHTLQVVVNEPRSYDGKYVFYLDTIFIIPKNNKDFLQYQQVPEFFPSAEPRRHFAFYNVKNLPQVNNIADTETVKNYAIQLGWAGMYDRAKEFYRYIAGRDPRDSEAQTGIILAELWSGNDKSAFLYLDSLIRNPVIDKKYRLSIMKFRAEEAGWRGDYKTAKAFYQSLLKMDPDDMEVIIGLGNVYTWSSEEDKAIAHYESAMKKFGNNIALMLMVAENYAKNKEFQRAILLYGRIIDLVPDDFTGYQKLASLYTRTGKPDDANKILALGRNRSAVEKVLKGDLLQVKVPAKEDIIAEYEKSAAGDFMNIQKHTNLLSAYEWYKQEDKVLKEYKAILAIHLYDALLAAEQNNQELLGICAKLDYLAKNGKLIDASADNELNKIQAGIGKLRPLFDDFVQKKQHIGWEMDAANIKSRLGEGLGRGHYLYGRIAGSSQYFEGDAAGAKNAIIGNLYVQSKAKEEYIAPFILLGDGDIVTFDGFLKRTQISADHRAVIDDIQKFALSYPVKKEKAKGLDPKERAKAEALKKDADRLRRIAYEQAVFAFYISAMDVLKKLGNYYIYLKNPNEAQSAFKEILSLQPDNVDANLQLADLYRWGRKYGLSKTHYEAVLEIDPANKKAIVGREEVLAVYYPEQYVVITTHDEPIVQRFKINLVGGYVFNDYFGIKGFYGYGYTSDKLGFQVSDIYSNAESKFLYHEAGAELMLNIYGLNTTVSGGYFGRNYRGELEFEYLHDYSAKFKRTLTNNYFATFRWAPITIPVSLYTRYEYADVDELTQAVKLGLFHHYINAALNVSFDFLPFFPFDRLAYRGNLEYKLISDENTRSKYYNKAMFTILRFPFSGIKFHAGGIYIYETSKFSTYSQDNPVYKKQANVPYYAPMNLASYGGYAEWIQDLKNYIGYYFEYIIGASYLQTSQQAKIYNPYIAFRGEYKKVTWDIQSSYIYSRSYQTFASNEPFKSIDVLFKVGKKFYSDYKSAGKSSAATAKVSSGKDRYSLAKDLEIELKLNAYDSIGIVEYIITISDREEIVVKKFEGKNEPPQAVKWLLSEDGKVSPGLYQIRLAIINKKAEKITSKAYLVKVDK